MISPTPGTQIDQVAVLRRLRAYAKACGGGAAAARAIGISPQYLSDIVSGRRDPSERVCRRLGLRRAVVYVVLADPPADPA